MPMKVASVMSDNIIFFFFFFFTQHNAQLRFVSLPVLDHQTTAENLLNKEGTRTAPGAPWTM